MQFNLPKTIDEMYTILNDLFYYYRIRREQYEEVTLDPLVLQRMQYSEKTETQLRAEARKILSGQHEREKIDYVNNLNSKISELEQKINLEQINAQAQIANVNELYGQSVRQLEEQAIKAGMVNSNVVVVQSTKLHLEKNQKITTITQKKDQSIATYTAEKQALQQLLSSSDTYFSSVHEKDVDKKVIELKADQEQIMREVFKYNNALDEKEQRYENTIKQTNLSLKIRYLEVTTGEFTKDQLVDMGYYNDVINCVCGYFDTLSALDAYYSFRDNKKLAIYLDDYYENILYLYRVNSGL